MKLRFVFTIAISVVVAIVIGSAAFAYWTTQTAIHESVRTLKFAVTKDLHDPESARFRSVQLRSLDGLIRERVKLLDIAFFRRSTPEQVLAVFRYNPEMFLLCGELNAKNAFGAYVGYKYFYATALRGGLTRLSTLERMTTSRSVCAKSAKKVLSLRNLTPSDICCHSNTATNAV